MVIANEIVYAKNLLNNGFKLSYNKRFKDIFILTKYYKHIELDENQTKDKIIEFLNKYDKQFDININNYDREKVSKIVYSVFSKTYTMRIIDFIKISNEELVTINTIKKRQLRRLLLVFCILSKIYNSRLGLRVQYNDLCKYSKIKSLGRLYNLIKQLEKLELVEEVEFSKFNLYVSNSDNDIIIDNFGICKNCGILIQINSPNNKYCFSCAKEIEKHNSRERKRKQRLKCHELYEPHNVSI